MRFPEANHRGAIAETRRLPSGDKIDAVVTAVTGCLHRRTGVDTVKRLIAVERIA
jgi:hypothetical protein